MRTGPLSARARRRERDECEMACIGIGGNAMCAGEGAQRSMV